MKVLHVITTIERGGAENQLVTLASLQSTNGIQVAVIYLKGQDELRNEFEISGVRVIDEIANKSVMSQLIGLRRILSQDFDMVHAHLPRSEVLVSIVNRKIPWIASRHNAEGFFPKAPSFFSRFLSRVVTTRCSRVVAISRSVENYLIRNREVSNLSKLEVIQYGFPILKSVKPSVPFSQPGTLKLVTISRLVPQKDLETLLRACSLIKGQGIPFHLDIIGAGEQGQSLRNLAEELEIGRETNFRGRVMDVFSILRESHIFLLTSLYEGFGLVLLEAIQAGLPLVVCSNEATCEVLGDDYIGLALPQDPTDVSNRIVSLMELKNQIIAKDQLKDRISIFKPDVMEKRIRSIYSSILS